MEQALITIVLAPLVAAAAAGLFGRHIGRAGAHWVTILGVALSFVLSAWVLEGLLSGRLQPFDGAVYTWGVSDGLRMEIGFLIDRLSALMMTVVTFVSLMVHIYTVGYMHEDPGYQRFFSYISLFTFAMLMLVMANNFLQLFFGWEAVGLVSYLLIGFWFKRPSAIHANLKAFVVNRVGDFGFLLGIAAVLFLTGSLDYGEVFAAAPAASGNVIEIVPGRPWDALTVACLLLFVGAMGKSAQVPLHVWLPDSMEGPTPISALIHAATMVTAGIFMVARMSPLFELSTTALSVVLVIGATTAFFMGLLGLVQNDIKRVVAYSTLSQLGYMTVALGVSAYAAGIFHLGTHAFFKALLFLAAGSVIIAMHHEQDMRKMGGLRRYMPITYWTALIGSLALIGFPGFSGFFSKDAIIESVHASAIPGAGYAYWCVLLGVFVTALYSFRMFFLVFHGEERMDAHTRSHLKESPWVVTLPLILLAIPSIGAGWMTEELLLFGGYFGAAIQVAPERDVLAVIGEHGTGATSFLAHGLTGAPFLLAMAGLATAWLLYLRRPDLLPGVTERFRSLNRVLVNKYYFDDLNEKVIAVGARGLGRGLWRVGDEILIDGLLVNGSARAVGWLAGVVRRVQSGYLYHYAFAMIIGLAVMLGWLLIRG
ncbi:MAG: NADH:ubiquinone oxidoreductase subunit L [Gammaproteobacteria bacterium SG8_31]|nr:MAG: NADH:ubiquinone oxidoreductase subunit L [Gammaproteobacteria bacterium SG8_31]